MPLHKQLNMREGLRLKRLPTLALRHDHNPCGRSSTKRDKLEAGVGIEPAYTALQAAA